jgi:flagellin FlaB
MYSQKSLIKFCKGTSPASIGIGAMIVFIAMVLVAGIAASVLIQTSTRLEMQALKTGQETIHEVASGLKIEGIHGYNASGRITKMAIEVATRAGSPHVDLAQTVLEISDSNNKYVLMYGGDVCNSSSIEGSIFDVANFGDQDDFDLIVLMDADESCTGNNPVINYGDHVLMAIDTNGVFSGLSPRSDVQGLVICEEGAPGIIGFTTPSSYSDAVVELQ